MLKTLEPYTFVDQSPCSFGDVTVRAILPSSPSLQIELFEGWSGNPVFEKLQVFPCKGSILCQCLFEVSAISGYDG